MDVVHETPRGYKVYHSDGRWRVQHPRGYENYSTPDKEGAQKRAISAANECDQWDAERDAAKRASR